MRKDAAGSSSVDEQSPARDEISEAEERAAGGSGVYNPPAAAAFPSS